MVGYLLLKSTFFSYHYCLSPSYLFLSFLMLFIVVVFDDKTLPKNFIISYYLLIHLGGFSTFHSLIFYFHILHLFHSLILTLIIVKICLIHMIGLSLFLFLAEYVEGLLFQTSYRNYLNFL